MVKEEWRILGPSSLNWSQRPQLVPCHAKISLAWLHLEDVWQVQCDSVFPLIIHHSFHLRLTFIFVFVKMIPLRLLGRAIPKSPLRQTSLRTLSSVSKSSYPRPSWLQPFQRTTYSAFSTSIAKREPAGDCTGVVDPSGSCFKLTHP